MAYADYKRDLLNHELNVSHVLDRYFHSGQSVAFIGANPAEESKLRAGVGSKLYGTFAVRVHPHQLVIVGSAHLGFSPVPEKLGKSFDPRTADIDIAVVSPELFDQWWTELQTAGLDNPTRQLVSRDLFWGFINPANTRDVSQHGQRWWDLFGGIATDRAVGVRGRLYRNFWSLQSYHRLVVVSGREKLLGEADGNF